MMKNSFIELDKKNTIYVYCRVSTKSQGDDGTSLDVQEERGIKYSKELNLKPIVIKEVGSGLQPYIEKRTQFTELMDGIYDDKVKNVWIDEDTRLTRLDTDLSTIHIEMKQKNVNLYVGSSPTPKKWDWITDLVDTIITKVNQNQIRTQVRKGIRSKRKLFQEGYYMKGNPPYGYKLVDKKLEIHEENSEWVKKMFDWYIKGISPYKIKQYLFENEVKPPRSKSDYFPQRTIFVILQNKNYIGIDTYGDLTNEIPPIIEKDIFQIVQKKIKTHSGSSRSEETNHDFLLRGIIKCTDGSDMSCLGKKKSRRNPLYGCNHRTRKYKGRTSGDCGISKSLRCDDIDNYVWNNLVDVLSQSHTIKETTKTELIGRNSSYTKRTFTNKIKQLNKKMMELDKSRLELEKRYYTNEMDTKKYDILIHSIEDKEEELMEHIQTNQMKLDSLGYKEKWVDWLDVHFSRMKEIREIEDFNKRRGVLHHYIKEIVVLDYDDDTKQHTLSIKFKFPLFDDNFEWLKNKNGSYKLDRFGRRRYNITEGETEMINPFTLHSSFHRNGFRQVAWHIHITAFQHCHVIGKQL